MTDRLRRLVIHIGCHKTGSTSLQDFAFEDKTHLPAAGVHYPRDLFADFPRQHSRLYRLLAKRDEAAVDAAFAEIVKGAREAGADTVFLSGEDLSATDAKGVGLLAGVADRYFEDKSFVIVVRNPRDYALSQFKHHLRHAAPLTEVGFHKRHAAGVGHRAIALWTQHFGPGVTLVYEKLAANLLANFYREALGVEVEVEDARRSNVSQDYLTLNIHNIFLKAWLSPEIDRIHWLTMLRHPAKMAFVIEELVARDLSSAADEDWKITGEPPAPAAGPRHDPVEVCDKMLTLFTMLREHFVRLQGAGAAPAPPAGEEG